MHCLITDDVQPFFSFGYIFPFNVIFLPLGEKRNIFSFLCDNIFTGGDRMKFKLIIDKNNDEEIVATVHGRTELTDKIEALVMAYENSDRIIAYTDDDFRILKFNEIECITVINGKIYAIDSDGEQLRLKQRLYELEKILPTSFIRINKSSFANENGIKEFSATFSGGVDAVFKCGYREYVSRRCFTAIKRRYEI